MTDGENILLKPIEKPKMASFKSLLKRSQKFSKDKGLKKDEVPKAIKKVRRENRT
jgi:pantoate kinase